jgi:hypothetical protein
MCCSPEREREKKKKKKKSKTRRRRRSRGATALLTDRKKILLTERQNFLLTERQNLPTVLKFSQNVRNYANLFNYLIIYLFLFLLLTGTIYCSIDETWKKDYY